MTLAQELQTNMEPGCVPNNKRPLAPDRQKKKRAPRLVQAGKDGPLQFARKCVQYANVK